MFMGRLRKFGLLLLRGLLLMLGLPFLVRHAVDELAALVSRERHAAGLGCFFHPIRKAVATEAGHIHKIDVLHIGPGAQMLDQPAESGGFELRLKLVVERHEGTPFAKLNPFSLASEHKRGSVSFPPPALAGVGPH